MFPETSFFNKGAFVIVLVASSCHADDIEIGQRDKLASGGSDPTTSADSATGDMGSANSSKGTPDSSGGDAFTADASFPDDAASASRGDSDMGPACSLPAPPRTLLSGWCTQAPACGDGVRNDCTDCSNQGDLGQICSTTTEPCDGTDLGGEKCETRGYTGGVLSCLACAIDENDCETCGPIGAGLLSCERACVPTTKPAGIAVADNGQELAIAYVDSESDGGSRDLYLARFRPDRTLIARTGPFSVSPAGGVSFIGSPNGWIYAYMATSGIEILAFDAAGQLKGHGGILDPPLDAAAPTDLGQAYSPQIVSNPDGSALLTWIEVEEPPILKRAIIAEDGSTTVAPAVLVSDGVYLTDYAVDRASAWVDGAYLVASFTSGTNPPATVTIVRVAATGAVGSTTTLVADTNVQYLAFAPYATHAHLFFWTRATMGYSLEWIDVGADGAVLSGPRIIDGESTPYPSTAAALIDRTVLLTGGPGPVPSDNSSTMRLTGRSLDSSGAPLGTPYVVAGTHGYIDGYVVRAVNGHALAGWMMDASTRPQIYLGEVQP